jgi:hypothetical protein
MAERRLCFGMTACKHRPRIPLLDADDNEIMSETKGSTALAVGL